MHEEKVQLVNPHGRAVDFSVVIPGMARRAESNQVLEFVLLHLRPRHYVGQFNRMLSARRDCTAMPAFEQQHSFQSRRDRRSLRRCHRGLAQVVAPALRRVSDSTARQRVAQLFLGSPRHLRRLSLPLGANPRSAKVTFYKPSSASARSPRLTGSPAGHNKRAFNFSTPAGKDEWP